MLITVQDNHSVQLPKELMDQVGWKEGVALSVHLSGGSIVLEEKRDWTIEGAQENLEYIVDRVAETKKPQFILYRGRTFVIAPVETHDGYLF